MNKSITILKWILICSKVWKIMFDWKLIWPFKRLIGSVFGAMYNVYLDQTVDYLLKYSKCTLKKTLQININLQRKFDQTQSQLLNSKYLRNPSNIRNKGRKSQNQRQRIIQIYTRLTKIKRPTFSNWQMNFWLNTIFNI